MTRIAPALIMAAALIAACDDPPERTEQCDNFVDDDGDQLVDCDDPDCADSAGCLTPTDADADSDVDSDADADEEADGDGADADEDLDLDVDLDWDWGPESAGCEPEVGQSFYSRLYDGRVICGRDRPPYWGDLYFEVTTAPGTEIELLVRTSERFEELERAPMISLATTPPALSPVDVAAALSSAGLSVEVRYLEVLAYLRCEAGPAQVDQFNVVTYCDP